MRGTGALLIAAAVALAVGVASCGEKEEPAIPPPPPSPKQQLSGVWDGRLTESGVSPFHLTVRIASLERARANRYHYTGIDCSGVWRYLGERENSFRFRELYRGHGGSKCVPRGEVTLTPAGVDRMRFVYNGGGYTSRGTLTRR